MRQLFFHSFSQLQDVGRSWANLSCTLFFLSFCKMDQNPADAHELESKGDELLDVECFGKLLHEKKLEVV